MNTQFSAMNFSGWATRLILLASLTSTGCSVPLKAPLADTRHRLIISIPEQKMLILEDGKAIASYPISTSKYGVGDTPDSNMTPEGKMEIAEKYGADLPLGSALKDRMPTGEIIAPDTPGRDPVVSRLLWLRGLESRNRNAYPRFIYIHGTPQESLLGTPASYGCIRMRSADVIALYELIEVGTKVWVVQEPLSSATQISTQD